ncbi:MAG: hypothetical protein OEZ34_11795, partial [Spirochaetia bacterium]|nr:hypothetical protein [Spirochaetia bacterium]
ELDRCPVHGHKRRLSLRDIGEIRHNVDVARSQAKRKGLKPVGQKITMFSCRCNCFSIDVE